MEYPPDKPFISPELNRARYEASKRRAAAFCFDYDTIAGLRFRALTPETYTRLVVIDSPFLWRGEWGAEDVRDYLWTHAYDATDKDAFLAQWQRHIDPPWMRWRRSRASRVQRVATIYARAGHDIQELVTLAFADEGAPGGRMHRATLEAQFIDLFWREYRWDAARVRATPIRQLFQFLACWDDSEFDKVEELIVADHLRAANAKGAA